MTCKQECLTATENSQENVYAANLQTTTSTAVAETTKRTTRFVSVIMAKPQNLQLHAINKGNNTYIINFVCMYVSMCNPTFWLCACVCLKNKKI